MPDTAEQFIESHDQCDGCVVVESLLALPEPLVMTEEQGHRLQEFFDQCPGRNRGITGFFKTLGIQIRESLTNGGPVYDMDTGVERKGTTYIQPGDCGTPIRNLVEIEQLRTRGFEK